MLRPVFYNFVCGISLNKFSLLDIAVMSNSTGPVCDVFVFKPSPKLSLPFYGDESINQSVNQSINP